MDVRRDYVQDERYIAGEHMDKVRPRSGREGALGYVRRDCVNVARLVGWVTCYPRVIHASPGRMVRYK